MYWAPKNPKLMLPHPLRANRSYEQLKLSIGYAIMQPKMGMNNGKGQNTAEFPAVFTW